MLKINLEFYFFNSITNDDLKFEEQNMPKFQEVKKQRNFQIPITEDAFNTMKK